MINFCDAVRCLFDNIGRSTAQFYYCSLKFLWWEGPLLMVLSLKYVISGYLNGMCEVTLS